MGEGQSRLGGEQEGWSAHRDRRAQQSPGRGGKGKKKHLRELVRRRLGVRARELGHQSGLAHRRESEQPDPRIPRGTHVKPFTAPAATPFRAVHKLPLQLGQFSLQHAQVRVRRLVLLRARHLGLDLLDLSEGRHGREVGVGTPPRLVCVWHLCEHETHKDEMIRVPLFSKMHAKMYNIIAIIFQVVIT